MLPVLVYLAGCAFCVYVIIHFGMFRESLAFAVCMATFLWIVGGASWLGRKLQAGVAARAASGGSGAQAGPLVLTDQDRELLKRAASQQRVEQ
jgi:hypothetical protein